MKIYVRMIDDSLTRYCGEPPSARMVEIELTKEQESKIIRKFTGKERGQDCFEHAVLVGWDEEPGHEEIEP